MDTVENNTPQKDKKRAVPLIVWFGGAVLTGGLITFALLYSKKSEQVTALEKRLLDTETLCSHEQDSLQAELRKASDSYSLLEADNNVLENNLAAEKARNKKLSSENATYAGKVKKCKEDNSVLQSALEKANEKNVTLENELSAMRSELEQMKSKLAECDDKNAEKSAMIDQQALRMKADSTDKANLLDSLKREDVSGYFNTTELTGAFGLGHINEPFAKDFWGISNVNGYVINKHFLAGFGFGLSKYDASWMAPVYLDFRYSFNRRKYTPYIFADGGFLIDLENLHLPNALFMNPGIGLYRSLGEHYAINMGTGLFVQRYDIRSSFINIKIGFTFKK